MKILRAIFILFGILVLSSIDALAENDKPILREERRIVIDGVEEVWRLEWAKPPSPACGPEDESWSTCPCTGFAFGEWGDLRLVRKRLGKKDELFSLNRLFEFGDDLPKPYDVSGSVLRRWDVSDGDYRISDSSGFADRVRTRPLAEVMHFVDYDHDGRASEFLLQIGTVPCGKRESVAVGISRKKGGLHVFSSTNRPKEPLILTSWQWEALSKAKGSVKVSDGLCGDHGSERERELELRAHSGNISATRRTYQCVDKGKRGLLIKKEDF